MPKFYLRTITNIKLNIPTKRVPSTPCALPNTIRPRKERGGNKEVIQRKKKVGKKEMK
jgi:hypothetical protein